jgi:hypothetical protein
VQGERGYQRPTRSETGGPARAREPRQARLAAVVDDSSLTVESQGVVRTIEFQSDHRCELAIRTAADGGLSARFHTDSRAAFDIEMSQTAAGEQRTRTRAAEPAVFRRIEPGPLRLVYTLLGADGPVRYQTEWVLVP